MINLNYLKYFTDAAKLGSITQAAKLNYVSSSAISQSIKWLEDWYQIELIQHGKNRFLLTEKGREVVNNSQAIFNEMEIFSEKMKQLTRPGTGVLNFSVQQSLANTIVSKAMKDFKETYPLFDLKVTIATSAFCKELMQSGRVNYSISIDNVNFNANAIPLYRGKFVFISAKNDKRKVEDAGFILTDPTKNIIEIKSRYFQRYKKVMPVNYSISSWGVIANLAISGNGVAYIPDYYLLGLNPNSYRIRKVDIKAADYNINFYSSPESELNKEHLDFISLLKKSFKT
jgi:DNA-binding transcriptional LysR family regulator